MPWHSLSYPSLALGILSAEAEKNCENWQVDCSYLNLRWADFLFTESRGQLTPTDYREVGEDRFLESAGEWVFSSSLHGTDEWRVEAYSNFFADKDGQLAKVVRMHRMAPQFIQMLAVEIADSAYDLIAFTSTFMQNVPSLALAKELKRLQPHTPIVFGGGNCDGPQGPALQKNFPFVDYVVSGEGEASFVKLLRYLEEPSDIAIQSIGGLSWFNEAGLQIVNPSADQTNLEEIAVPSYRQYFTQLANSQMDGFVQPQLVMETARGCWWGEKHHCKFCGLNGSGMNFRSKSAHRALEEIRILSSEHKILDIIIADNIMDSRYFQSLLPELEREDWDLRIHYEVKSNLKAEHLQLLQRCGVRHIQPGIESLSSRILQLMDKGVSGAQNIQALRDSEEANLTVSWNYLVGFPGEDEEDYRLVMAQLPRLHHLQPPSGSARLVVERFSPYFSDASLGFPNRTPNEAYSLIYGLEEVDLEDMVYLFEAPSRGINENLHAEFQARLSEWRDSYNSGCELVHSDTDVGIEIRRRHADGSTTTTVLTDAVEMSIYRLLAKPMKESTLERSFSPKLVSETLGRLYESGLLFRDTDSYIALSTRLIPFRVRIHG